MKIGIDARLWNETGVGRYIRSLVRDLQKIDNVNEYVLFTRRGETEGMRFRNPRWHTVETEIPWHTLKEQLQMPKYYNDAGLDLLHIPYFSVPVMIKTPFVITIHDLTISHFATGKATTKPLPIYMLKRLGYHFVLNRAMNRAHRIVTVSNTVKSQILAEYPKLKDKVQVIYEAGNLEQGRVDNRIPGVGDYILYVGNAHPHKNLANLIKAFQIIRKQARNIKLVLIGKTDYFYSCIQKMVFESELRDAVVFPGEVSNSTLASWYANARLFAFPSLSEGFGIPGLEAMSQKCPVAVSDIPVFHEIYGQAALYFNPLLPEDIANTCIKILTGKKTVDALKENGIKQTHKYSWKEMANQTLTLYESCNCV